ncbi:uncharacterized protein [Macrobrachium rosenbergii]|uniref:uncharacterized protein n=1 Tax=Macrobrachium rosenbergii TaxID=79674 RepID=UPI0034D51959
MNQYVEAVARLAAEEGEVSWHSLTDLYATHLPHFAGTNFYLPWHRYFLWVVELVLQDNGYCDLTIPYFDWTLDVGDLAGSVAWQANSFGGDGNDETRCVRYNPFHSPSNPKWSPCLMRQFDNYVWLPDAVSLAHLLANDNYTTFRIHLEAMSGLFQMFVGGHVLTPEKFYDPIFLSHMAFLDKVWDDWMARNGERSESYLASTSYFEVEPFGVTPKDVMKSSYLGVSYVLPSKGSPCLRDDGAEISDDPSGMSENKMLTDSATTHIDNDGYDTNGFDSQGYDRSGYNKDSFNRDGYSIAGIDRMGYDRYGLDAQGCTALGVPYCRSSLNNTKLAAPVFDSYGYTKSGFNILGLDRRGYDVFGFDLEGYDGEKCNYHHKGPFYKLLKAQIEQRLNGFTDEALLKNIERTCPPVTPLPDWWLEYNYFSKTDIEVLRQQEKTASILRPMVSPHRMDSRSLRLQSEPYLPQEYFQRLCLNLRPYSGCQAGDPVVDCNEEEVCRPYTAFGREDAPSYFSYSLNDPPVTTKPSFSFYPFLTSLFDSPPFDPSYESPGPISFFPISPEGGGFPQVESAPPQALLQCARRPNIVCRALGCDGVCRPTFIDAITGKESACDGCVDQSGQLREEGSTWTGTNCESCTCNHREMICHPVTCPTVPCTHPAKPHGACCPDCQHGCNYDGYTVPEGETVADVNDTCIECQCTGGSLVCAPVVCPELTCSDPILKPGECCAFCNSCDGAEEGDTWQPDPCTHCQCKQGEQLCYSLGLRPPVYNFRRICPVCHHCDYQGHHIMNGDSKLIAPCITCSCNILLMGPLK